MKSTGSLIPGDKILISGIGEVAVLRRPERHSPCGLGLVPLRRTAERYQVFRVWVRRLDTKEEGYLVYSPGAMHDVVGA